MTYELIRSEVEKFKNVTTRPMFGYKCYSSSGKFFVGFNNKNDYQVIVRLPKGQQTLAIRTNGIRPFSHGAKMGWIEIDANQVATDDALKWIKKGHKHAKILAK